MTLSEDILLQSVDSKSAACIQALRVGDVWFFVMLFLVSSLFLFNNIEFD